MGPLLGAPLCQALVGCNLQKQVLHEAAALGLTSLPSEDVETESEFCFFVLFFSLSLLP